MTSLVFPGQGSQFVGMTQDFYDEFSVVRETFDMIETSTKIKIKDTNKEGEIIDVLVRKFEVRKFYKKTPKYMKFKTMSGKKVEIRTNNPKDYVVEDL